MVLLTITPALKLAIELYNELSKDDDHAIPDEPPLNPPTLNAPISHAQILQISQFLRQAELPDKDGYRLDTLLKGTTLYTAPAKPKPQPSAEYVALMKRLRKEEEARAYDRMINPPNPYTTALTKPSDEEDEITYADVNRQLALIINVLVSIIACSVAIWIAARHWSVPQRLALSMFGSAAVAVAEVVIYMGYLGRIKEAKTKEKSKVEEKTVVDTWVIGKKDKKQEAEVRYRKGRHR